MTDWIEHNGGIEAIDYIAAKLGLDGFRAHWRSESPVPEPSILTTLVWYLRRVGGD